MLLAQMEVETFTDVLSSNTPAPGGGSVAALEGAFGSALSAMVCQLTIGKKKYSDVELFAKEASAQAEQLKKTFLLAMEQDTEAFNELMGAYALPKATEEDKQKRSRAIQERMIACTKSPLKVMELTYEALLLTKSLLHKTNSNALSDLGVSALSLKAASQGAWLNVLINVNSIKDETIAKDLKSKGQTLLSKSIALADEIYLEIEQDLD